jgi:hypothetical protein
LVELVVALTVAGLALAAGYQAFATVSELGDRAIESSDAALRTSAMRQALGSWIQGARLTVEPGGTPFRGLDGNHEGAPDDRLTILTTASTPLGARETVFQLYVDRNEETPEGGLVAEFSEWRGSGTLRLEVDRRIAGIEARYLTTVLGQREWRPSWISSTVLPAAVELRLVSTEGESLPGLLDHPILVSLPGGR